MCGDGENRVENTSMVFWCLLTNSLAYHIFILYRYGGERYEERDMQIRVREKFGELQKLDEGRIPWKMVNAAQSIEAVESDIWSVVNEAVNSCKDKPLKKMWQEGDYDMSSKKDEQGKEN